MTFFFFEYGFKNIILILISLIILFIATNPEPRECPYSGKFSVAGISQMERQKRSPTINGKAIINVSSSDNIIVDNEIMSERKRKKGSNLKKRKRKRRNSVDKEESCEDEITTLEVGCDTSDTLEFRSQCASSRIISGKFLFLFFSFLITVKS